MFRNTIASVLAFAVVGGLLPTHTAVARTDVTLAPITVWTMNGTESGCALRRAFGTVERPFTLEFQRFRPGDTFQLAIDGEDLSGLVRRNQVSIEYGDLGVDKDTSFQPGTTMRDGKEAVPSIFLSSEMRPSEKTSGSFEHSKVLVTPAIEAAVKQVAVVWGENRIVAVTGSLGKPFAAMRACTDGLVETWGLDPVVQNALTRSAVPQSPMTMVRAIQAAYPMTMASQGKQGRVNFRALVDAQGVVTECTTMKSYNERAFDDLACKVIRRTKFDPALDKDGKPVASFYVETVNYRIN